LDKRTGDGHTLLLAAGEFVGLVVQAVLKSNLGGETRTCFDHVGVFGTAVIHRHGDVLDDAELLNEIVALKDEPEVSVPCGGKVIIIEMRHVLAAEKVVTRKSAGRGSRAH
jgi:hypothetical protein